MGWRNASTSPINSPASAETPIRGMCSKRRSRHSLRTRRGRPSRAPRAARRPSRFCSWRRNSSADDAHGPRGESMTFKPHAATRRELLIASGTLFAWAYLPKLARAEGRDPRLLVIVLRGALDGLAAVAPVGDPDWVALRGNNALTLDGKAPALPLDSFFALNPAMPNLHRMFKANEAIVVHAAATPYRERSHFDGQDVLESGLPKPGAA